MNTQQSNLRVMIFMFMMEWLEETLCMLDVYMKVIYMLLMFLINQIHKIQGHSYQIGHEINKKQKFLICFVRINYKR